MLAADLKQMAANLNFDAETGYARIRDLITSDLLDAPLTSSEIVRRISETRGERWRVDYVATYMKPFLASGIVHSVRPEGARANYWALTSVARNDVVRLLAKGRRVAQIEHELFSPELTSVLRKNFSKELFELNGVFGVFGNSTAFLLRKILEKLLIIVFRRTGRGALIEDRSRSGEVVGLETMLEVAMRERVNGGPLLSGKTGSAVKGAKFLGDTAAHNPLADVDTEDILPQMPYIVMAYKELASHL